MDVFKNNNYICSIGAVGYNDYTTYLRDKGLEYARKRRFLYSVKSFQQLQQCIIL